VVFGFFYFAALFTQNVLGFDPMGTALALLPFVAAMLVTNSIATLNTVSTKSAI
jgi:hypothetical protein